MFFIRGLCAAGAVSPGSDPSRATTSRIGEDALVKSTTIRPAWHYVDHYSWHEHVDCIPVLEVDLINALAHSTCACNRDVTQMQVPAGSIVKDLDVVEDIGTGQLKAFYRSLEWLALASASRRASRRTFPRARSVRYRRIRLKHLAG